MEVNSCTPSETNPSPSVGLPTGKRISGGTERLGKRHLQWARKMATRALANDVDDLKSHSKSRGDGESLTERQYTHQELRCCQFEEFELGVESIWVIGEREDRR